MTAIARTLLRDAALLLGLALLLSLPAMDAGQGRGGAERTLTFLEKSINAELDNYYADHGHRPATLDELVRPPHPYFGTLPVEPGTGTAASWLVTSKAHLPAGVHPAGVPPP